MNRTEFQAMMDTMYDEIKSVNESKGHDYAGDDDALANFKSAAKRLKMDPLQVWAVYADKHWSAIMTYCADYQVKSEPIEGRITDAILYLFLLLGLVEEHAQQYRLDS